MLTDAYNWRWVFYINVPFGIAACAMLWVFFKDTAKDNSLKFDWFGFGALSIGLAALQLLLDRGTTKDWFSSPEIVIEAIVAGIGLYLFLVHMLTAKKPFIPREIFRDRNFVSGLGADVHHGDCVLLASSALLSPYLQNLSGRSVTQTGFLMVPRGFGVMFAMMFASKLTMKMDPANHHDGGRRADALVAMGDDRLDPRHQCRRCHLGDLRSGLRHGPGLCPHEHGGLCHPDAAAAHRRRRPVQPDAQYRQRHRRVADLDHPDPLGPDHPCPAWRAWPRLSTGRWASTGPR